MSETRKKPDNHHFVAHIHLNEVIISPTRGDR
ncbi:Uncharacterised protein [Mycobacterium tuberculosis]|nr:Uncharacterised protein [Mycobacterium tuberculosis]